MKMPIKGEIPHLGQNTRAGSVLIFQRPQYSFSLGRILSLVVDCGLISEKVASWNVVFSVVGLQLGTSCSRIIVDLFNKWIANFHSKNHSQPQKSNSIQKHRKNCECCPGHSLTVSLCLSLSLSVSLSI